MSLSPKMKSIFSIIAILGKMHYEFENKTVLKLPKKLIIAPTNQLVCYLIVKVSYARSLLITKLIFIDIGFKVSREASYTYNGSAKPKEETRPC